jgi:uncharacterized protein
MIGPDELNKSRKRIEGENRKFYARLKKRPPAGIDDEVYRMDEEIFSGFDCLSCANCCKTISPVFKDRDIDRISRHFRMKPGEFTSRYLFLDEEGDYVLKTSPCPFLLSDNKCSIYEHRPYACKSYPHTGSLPLTKSVELVIKNSAVCPVVHEITQRLKEKYS